MKKWLKKHIPSAKSMTNSSELKGFRKILNEPAYWKYDQQSVARGVAAGLAAAVIPGIQFFYAALLVLLFKGNLPIALLSTLITNPLTFVPIMYFIYSVGKIILLNGSDGEFVIHQFHWDFSSFHAFWTNLSGWFLQFGKAFLVGMPVVSLCLGVIGYFGVILFWKVILKFRKSKK